MKEPKTADDLLALPIRCGFSSVERIIDGRKVVIPVVPAMRAFWVEEDTVQGATDEDGQHWALCKDDDGWCRKRVF
jgi:hypothetical protein